MPQSPETAPAQALLALDGATDQLALALVRADGQTWTRDAPGGAQASATLIPLLQALLLEAGVQGRELAGIAYGRGPGAFTGLRAVCAVVQGLALGWERPVLELDSLALVAEAARQQNSGFTAGWVAMDARMGECYAAPYRWNGSAWQAEQAPGLWNPQDLQQAWGPPTPPWTGSAQPLLAPEAAASWQAGGSRAAALAALARQSWAAPAWKDAAEALPLYVRDKVAQTTAEREAAAAAVAR
ncbi:tRNA (adenosine(37)-N6)-threonylcarbamoyltransferase complex dimerization subunit type 1 TsaB [Inhella proteolytica]|uniref:tRNA (Adenosine(37)-N6)-threonylcarbamoyltransferase complex dimerization subunit type 1 TsaB n=1 Tax=Inhella proteolytica TaxID=2795029 RepID=A0A931NJG3_9BURK|nr:tRNA (adenosine(37)-N6)-threonylcarbamoyltransferase complex dimerization subunit type 1 TsaB [Inhella proteolytica]MBH9578989.1 tRNA (adenosine(37)-N6)-threonylcarbamoyltransferase complex dimerization subunit type 1 TsaB [Inhella proteolytica]